MLRKNQRRRLGGWAAESFFRGLAATSRRSKAGRRAREAINTQADVAYGSHPQQRLDVLRPKATEGRLPALVYVHGGGFRILSKDTHWAMAARFAMKGFVVFNIDYRLAPKHPYPAAIEDACAALQWVLEHGADYGADVSQLVLAGESAGANLVCGMTLATCTPRPEPYAAPLFEQPVVPMGILPACGILQVTDWERLPQRKPQMKSFVVDRLREVCVGYLGDDEPHGVAAELADPVVALEKATGLGRPWPPTVAICGTKDPLLDDSRRLNAAIRRLGGACDLHIYPGELHAFHAFNWRKAAQDAWRRQYDFLDRIRASRQSGD